MKNLLTSLPMKPKNSVSWLLVIFMIVIGPVKIFCQQQVDFCGMLPVNHAISTNPDSILYDRFGNTYDRFLTTSPVTTTTFTSGFFSVEMNAPNDFKSVIDSTLADFSTYLIRKSNNTDCGDIAWKDLIRLKINTTTDSPYLMASSPIFIRLSDSCSNSAKGLNYSNPYKIINYGNTGSSPAPFDALLVINISKPWNKSYSAMPTSNQFDARSVILHELLHIFAFASLIQSDGNGDPNAGYNIYDSYLYILNSSGLHKLLLGNCSKNCWKLNPLVSDFEDLVTKNCTSGTSQTLVIGNPTIASINGINGYTNNVSFNNYVSHLHPDCIIQNPNFIMQPTIAMGIRRTTITSKENQILCLLGYKAINCEGCSISVNNEFEPASNPSQCCTKVFSTCPNNEITISYDDLLCNDEEDNSKDITDFFLIAIKTMSR